MSSCRKAEFSLPKNAHYLNSAYMGPISRQTERAGLQGVSSKNFPAGISSADFFQPSEAARTAFGQIVHTSAERIAIVPAVSYGMAAILRNLSIEPGQNVIVPAEEFPSNINQLRSICRRANAELRTVPRPAADSHNPADLWSQTMHDAIDAQTALVVLTNAHWTDGTRFNMRQIAAKARGKGAVLVVDGTQSVGAHPFDFDDLKPDALLCAAYKFLLAPYTTGFMVLGDRFMDAEPLEHNWINRVHSEDFTRLIDYQDSFQPGARRHDFGEHSSTILMPMLQTALEQLLDWGVEQIAAHCESLFGVLVDALAGSDYRIQPLAQQHGHLFGIGVPNPDNRLRRLAQELEAANIYVSIRGSSLRVSTHIFNDENDVLALARTLKAVQ